MSEKVINVANLTKEFKELRAVDDLSFQVKEGEILGLLGPNGSGKSTTINCILSLLKIDKGNIEIPGCVRNGVPEDIANKIFDDMIDFAKYALKN